MNQINIQDEDQSDPRSWNYQRIYYRPKIKWGKIILNIVTLLLTLAGIRQVLGRRISLIICICVCIVYLFFYLREILICCVQIYQYFAPVSVRSMCRFEPSCSQYMILCLQKYGPLHGIYRGIKRIRRCAHGDGGYDIP